jgi:hypothetical protein
MTDSFEAQRGLLGLAKITPAFDLDAPGGLGWDHYTKRFRTR